MRGPGQIAELARIAEPDVGVIVSIGPVHLELLGSIEAIAAAKAELIAALAPGRHGDHPGRRARCSPHICARTWRPSHSARAATCELRLRTRDATSRSTPQRARRSTFEVDFTEAHLRQDLLAAVAAARAVGVQPGGRLELALSPGRGQRRLLPGGVTLIDDAYNANPVSMRAALDALGRHRDRSRTARVAVLGDMLELGPDAERLPRADRRAR